MLRFATDGSSDTRRGRHGVPRMRFGAALLSAILAACSGEADPDAQAVAPVDAPAGAAAAFDAIESRLLAADSLAIDFTVTAEGAVTAELEGRMRIAPDRRLVLEARGQFMTEPLEVRLVSDGRAMVLTGGARRIELATPPALREAVVVGFMRMGVLHNVARLVAGRAPDHADGGVGDWVVVSGIDAAEDGAELAFELEVAGTPAGRASLVLNAATGLPERRVQTVAFAEGEMRVAERYSAIHENTVLPDAVFSTRD